MKQSKLPKELEQVTIAMLRVGEVAYTLPWAIEVDADGTLWIRGDYPALRRDERTSGTIKIERIEDGVKVWRDSIPPYMRYTPEDVRHAVEVWQALPVVLV